MTHFKNPGLDPALIAKAAEAVAGADALLLCAGAGMGVDSGLPDFRGDQGFWKAYPPYARLGLGFVDLANPRWFGNDPALAWGFYGHRLNLYRAVTPHAGFEILLEWGRQRSQGYFVFTSNVDGQFQKAGFDPERICEVHGSIHWLQCIRNCGIGVFAANCQIVIDESTMRAADPLPVCPECGALARPNVLMFGDWDWDVERGHPQEVRLNQWLENVTGRIVIVECGAGTAIPTVRRLSEQVVAAMAGTLIRLNVRDPQVPPGQIGLACGALTGLRAIHDILQTRSGSSCP